MSGWVSLRASLVNVWGACRADAGVGAGSMQSHPEVDQEGGTVALHHSPDVVMRSSGYLLSAPILVPLSLLPHATPRMTMWNSLPPVTELNKDDENLGYLRGHI